MGHRANFVLVERSTTRAFVCHWCATSLVNELFFGPDVAPAYITSHREIEVRDLLDDVWAEGGAHLDLDRRTLLLWGGEDLACDPPLRRAYLALARAPWSGFDVAWAHRGVRDLAARSGVDPEPLRRSTPERTAEALHAPGEPDWVDCVVSVLEPGGRWRFAAVAGYVETYAGAGPALLDWARAASLPETLDLRSTLRGPTTGGLIVDVPAHTVRMWTVDPRAPIERHAAAWPGWRFEWIEDRDDEQVRRAGGALRLFERSDDALIDQLRAILLPARASGGPALIREMGARDRAAGRTVEIAPTALDEEPEPLSAAERERRFDRALAALRSKR